MGCCFDGSQVFGILGDRQDGVNYHLLNGVLVEVDKIEGSNNV